MTIRDLRLTVLGSGTSAGVPVIGCTCEVCRSDDPRDERLRTAACIEFTDPGGQERVILIDASPDLRQQVLRTGITRCDAILFTHNHVDHTFGLDEVRRFNVMMQAPIDVYAELRTLEHLSRVYRHIFERERNVNDSFVARLIPHQIDAEGVLDLFGLRVTPLRLLHGRLPVLGFRFEPSGCDDGADGDCSDPGSLPLAWCTDVSSIPPETWPRLDGLKTLFLDMLRERSHPTHFSLADALTAADRIAAARTWFIHMTHDIGHAELTARLPEDVGLAYDGLVVPDA